MLTIVKWDTSQSRVLTFGFATNGNITLLIDRINQNQDNQSSLILTVVKRDTTGQSQVFTCGLATKANITY